MLPVLSAIFWGGALAAQPSTNPAPAGRIILVDPSSMPVGGGEATLIIGPLRRADGIYRGDYKLKVFPYFLKNEKGTLAINVSDQSLAEADRGRIVLITGTATTSGKNGKSRHVDVTVIPKDINHGTLQLRFMAGAKPMTFEPAYHFAGAGTPAAVVQTADTKP